MMRYYVRLRDNPQAENYGEPMALFRLDAPAGIADRWDSEEGQWQDNPNVIEATGIGGTTDFQQVDDAAAKDFIASHSPPPERFYRSTEPGQVLQIPVLMPVLRFFQQIIKRGGPGSGHFAHEGRPGEVGGSQPGDGGGGGRLSQRLDDTVFKGHKFSQADVAGLQQALSEGLRPMSRDEANSKEFWLAPDGTIFDAGEIGHENAAMQALVNYYGAVLPEETKDQYSYPPDPEYPPDAPATFVEYDSANGSLRLGRITTEPDGGYAYRPTGWVEAAQETYNLTHGVVFAETLDEAKDASRNGASGVLIEQGVPSATGEGLLTAHGFIRVSRGGGGRENYVGMMWDQSLPPTDEQRNVLAGVARYTMDLDVGDADKGVAWELVNPQGRSLGSIAESHVITSWPSREFTSALAGKSLVMRGRLPPWTALVLRGGPGSGHYGHAGRPGEVGGSAPGEGEAEEANAGPRWRSDYHSPAGTLKMDAVGEDIARAVAERPSRESHGNTGKNAFFLVNGQIVSWDKWQEMTPEEMATAIAVHSHSADNWRSFREREDGALEPFQPLNSRDIALMFRNYQAGHMGPASVLILGDGRMETLEILPDTNPRVLGMREAALAKALEPPYADRLAYYEQHKGDPGYETNQMARGLLHDFADDNGLNYQVGRWRPDPLAARSIVLRGGPGSGHFGHEGRPGEVGGSAPGGGVSGRQTVESRMKARMEGERTPRQVGQRGWGDLWSNPNDRIVDVMRRGVAQIESDFEDALGIKPATFSFTDSVQDFVLRAQPNADLELVEGMRRELEGYTMAAVDHSSNTIWVQDEMRGREVAGTTEWKYALAHELSHVIARERDINLSTDEVSLDRQAIYAQFDYPENQMGREYTADLLAAHVMRVAGHAENYAFDRGGDHPTVPFYRGDYASLNRLLRALDQPRVAIEQSLAVRAVDDMVLLIVPKAGEALFLPRSEVEDAGNAPFVIRGGPGSGHFAHEGRPGEIGGSQPGDGGEKYPLGRQTLLPLARTATHYETFKDFERDYQSSNFHGLYWHLTNGPDFTIEPERIPQEASSLAGPASSSRPGLMVTTDIGNWVEQLGPRTHAALIDLGDLRPRQDYWNVGRGFGHEIWVDKPAGAKVIATYPLAAAQRMSERHYSQILPQNQRELLSVYQWAHANLTERGGPGSGHGDVERRPTAVLRRIIIRGGAGSGHFGHEGRPGEVGGSAPGEGSTGGYANVPTTTPEKFREAFEREMADSPYRNHVNHYTLDELKGGPMEGGRITATLLSPNEQTGVAVKEHDDGRVEATALFNRPGGRRGDGLRLLEQTVRDFGVNYVEALGPRLNKLYESIGFEVVERFPFDKALAPANWDYARFDEPPYYTMRLAKPVERALDRYSTGGIIAREGQMPLDLFSILDERLRTEPEKVKAEQDAAIIAEFGQDYFDAHKATLDEEWGYGLSLFGYSPQVNRA